MGVLYQFVSKAANTHLHEGFLIMEEVLEHPERTLAEIVDNMYYHYVQKGHLYAFQSVGGLSYFFAPASSSRYAN